MNGSEWDRKIAEVVERVRHCLVANHDLADLLCDVYDLTGDTDDEFLRNFMKGAALDVLFDHVVRTPAPHPDSP